MFSIIKGHLLFGFPWYLNHCNLDLKSPKRREINPLCMRLCIWHYHHYHRNPQYLLCVESKMLTVKVTVRKTWEWQVESHLGTASETWMQSVPHTCWLDSEFYLFHAPKSWKGDSCLSSQILLPEPQRCVPTQLRNEDGFFYIFIIASQSWLKKGLLRHIVSRYK